MLQRRGNQRCVTRLGNKSRTPFVLHPKREEFELDGAGIVQTITDATETACAARLHHPYRRRSVAR